MYLLPGQIGYFKIISESAIAAGVRRIEAVTAGIAEDYVNAKVETEGFIRQVLKNPKDVVKGVENLLEENKKLLRQVESLNQKVSAGLGHELKSKTENVNGVDLIVSKVEADQSVIKMGFHLTLSKQIETCFWSWAMNLMARHISPSLLVRM